jgi:pyrrolidone-carboxylate peptidase
MRFFLTGFDKFGNVEENPTLDIVESIAREQWLPVTVQRDNFLTEVVKVTNLFSW